MAIDRLGLKGIRVGFSAGERYDLFAVQGDTLTRGYKATLIDRKTQQVITPDPAYRLELIAKRPDTPDQYIVSVGAIESDTYVVYLSTNMLAVPGPLLLQLALKDGDTAVIRSAPWTINVPAALDMDGYPVEGQDVVVDFTQLRADMDSFEERAAVYEGLSSGSWTLTTGPVYSQSSPSRDVPFRKNLTTKSGYGILHMDFVAKQASGVVATLPTDAPRPLKTIEYQLFDAGSVWVDAGDNRVQAQGLAVGVRYLFNLLGFY
jgi:hypothetical protein